MTGWKAFLIEKSPRLAGNLFEGRTLMQSRGMNYQCIAFARGEGATYTSDPVWKAFAMIELLNGHMGVAGLKGRGNWVKDIKRNLMHAIVFATRLRLRWREFE